MSVTCDWCCSEIPNDPTTGRWVVFPGGLPTFRTCSERCSRAIPGGGAYVAYTTSSAGPVNVVLGHSWVSSPAENDEEIEETAIIPRFDLPVEPGSIVWHRLTDEGPWVAVQPTKLDTSTTVNSGLSVRAVPLLVNDAWIVLTGTGQFLTVPTVALTRRKPDELESQLRVGLMILSAVIGLVWTLLFASR